MRRWTLLAPAATASLLIAACGGENTVVSPLSPTPVPSSSASPGASPSVRPSATSTPLTAASPPATVASSPTLTPVAGATPTSAATTAATPTAASAQPTPTRVPPTQPAPTATPTEAPPPPTPLPQPVSATVNVNDSPFTFSPRNLTVPAGSTVTWIWGGTAFHDVTSTSFPSSDTRKEGTHTVTFSTPGTYAYVCQVHIGQNMRGTVTVQ